jgi:CRISPR system Cascade subunit CasD
VTGRVLALYLDGPLQSWGYQSRFDRRTSLSYPTRSAILGILCAALGIDWRDTDGLERLENGLGITVFTFGVPSMLFDYHTVGGGYDAKTQRQSIVPKADGKAGETVLTYREYLQDARFGVLLSGEDALLQELQSAMGDPQWGIWLGRKSCIPASPVIQGLFETEDEALVHLEARAGRRRTRRVGEATRFEQGTDTLLDRPVDFSTRRFKPRRIDNEPL